MTMDKQENAKMNKVPRLAGVELLRSIAMFMVIALHYLDKGGLLTPMTEKQDIYSIVAWVLESFAIVAVNTYVLVSGYFLVESGFKWKRLVQLVCQVLFYSLLVPVILVLTGQISLQSLTLYDVLFYIFPVQMEHYWFATAYVLLYLFVPVLSAGVKNISKEALQKLILLVLLVFSVSKTILPFMLGIDKHGNDVVWFLCLFLVAAYIRLYGMPIITNKKRAALLYGAGCLMIYILAMCIAYFSNLTGKFAYFVDSTYDYNHLLCFLASVGLFLLFLYWKMPEKRVATIARRIAPYTFGVYLFHENVAVRYLWPQWFQVETYGHTKWFPLHFVITLLVIFAVGIGVDFLRSKLFGIVENIKGKKRD